MGGMKTPHLIHMKKREANESASLSDRVTYQLLTSDRSPLKLFLV